MTLKMATTRRKRRRWRRRRRRREEEEKDAGKTFSLPSFPVQKKLRRRRN
jgi:hypothetical protein